MENISIQSLRELRTRGLNNIITGCISEGVGEDDIRSIISEFSNTNLKYPVPAPMISICFRYLKAFFKIHYGDIVWKVIDNIPIGLEGESFICWYHNGEHHYVMLNKESYDELIGMCTMLEFVNKKEEGEEELKELNEYIEKIEGNAKKFVKWYLYHLRLIEKEEDTPGDFIVNSEEIKENPEIIDINGNTSRFSSAIWADEIQKKSIVLAGLGGIGSYTAYLLSRMQPKQIVLYDDDLVESVNLSGQMYSLNDVTTFKVNAMASKMADYSLYHSVITLPERFTNESMTSDIMISGFDSMESRTVFFEAWLNHIKLLSPERKARCLLIDGRLSAECLQVFCIKGDDDYCINRYREKYLFDSSKADETVCSYKQTTYMANMIGSIIVNLFTNFVANEIVPNMRALPFFTEYEASTMQLKLMEQ